MKALWFRIGADKAGTVSLAELVEKNRTIFLKNNFYTPIRNCLPVIDFFINKHELNSINTFDSTHFLSQEDNKIYFEELMFSYDRFKDKNIFLTTETFWGRLSKKNTKKCSKDIEKLCEQIIRYFKHHNIKIILNVRRIDTYIESLYKQEIKAGRYISIEQLKKRLKSEKCLDLLILLEKIFGRDNIIIRPFERSQMIDRDLVADTLSTIGLYGKINELQIQIENEGLHRDLCETLIILNKQHGKLVNNKRLLDLSKILKTKYNFQDIKYILSQKERTELISSFSSFYDYLSQHYNNKKPFFIDPLPDDNHLSYSLSQDRFNLIKQMIFDIRDKQPSIT
jgi:hypothetical protein